MPDVIRGNSPIGRPLGWAGLVLLVGCASFVTPYQPVGFRGGYTDTKLDDSTYVVDIRVNSYTSPARALTYFSRRASEVCHAAGHGDFVVLEERVTTTDDGDSEHYGRVRCR